MNQGLDYEISQVMPEALLTGRFTSLATFQQPDGVLIGAGQPSGNYINVAGMVNVPCMDAVPSTLRVQATQVRDLQDIMSSGLRHLLLNGYYPQATPDGQIPTTWRAVVDGILYIVLGVEHDSQNQMTRCELKLLSI